MGKGMTEGEMRAAIQRVRDLHKPFGPPGAAFCSECYEKQAWGWDNVTWPCRTIRALNGDDA